MKSIHSSIVIILAILLVFSSCTSGEKSATEQTAGEQKTANSKAAKESSTSQKSFPMPSIPVMITNPDDIIEYLSTHFWDEYNFSDTTLINQPDITEQGFVDYIQLLNELSQTDAVESINIMLNKAKPYPAMYSHFALLYEKYLYDPNSPFRSEALYTPVVNHLVTSNVLSTELQGVFSLQQKMILKNRPGTTASNFAYTLANGSKKMMHNLQSNYLILFFTNPGCPACASTTEQIENSTILQELFALNNINNKVLTVLSIYPDASVDEWRKALPKMPQQHWVNGYDDGEIIYNKLLYDIQAIPTLYLLDKNKKVILKDVPLGEIEEYFMEIR